MVRWGKISEEIITSKIIYPIIDIYFGLICTLGLQNELNAQNIIVGFKEDFEPTSIILRDLMGIEKDITIRNTLGLSTDFDSGDYKIIRKDDIDKYRIRHSFAFDFKLSHYVIKPIIETGAKLKLFNRKKKFQEVKDYIKIWLNKLPDDYFPSNKIWYSHRKELLANKKEFIKNKNPLLR